MCPNRSLGRSVIQAGTAGKAVGRSLDITCARPAWLCRRAILNRRLNIFSLSLRSKADAQVNGASSSAGVGRLQPFATLDSTRPPECLLTAQTGHTVSMVTAFSLLSGKRNAQMGADLEWREARLLRAVERSTCLSGLGPAFSGTGKRPAVEAARQKLS